MAQRGERIEAWIVQAKRRVRKLVAQGRRSGKRKCSSGMQKAWRVARAARVKVDAGIAKMRGGR